MEKTISNFPHGSGVGGGVATCFMSSAGDGASRVGSSVSDGLSCSFGAVVVEDCSDADIFRIEVFEVVPLQACTELLSLLKQYADGMQPL